MASTVAYVFAVVLMSADPAVSRDLTRTLKADGRDRSYLVHIPAQCDVKRPTPVVLVLHGAAMDARLMVEFCGLNRKADEAGFVAVYPNGTGPATLLATWNSGGVRGFWAANPPDDVAFIRRLLDDLASVVSVDPKRVFAAGLSNGGMMCYRLASELSERIAAIAPVAGTIGGTYQPKRPVPVIHFHGTADRIVPFAGPAQGAPDFIEFKSVEETIRACVKSNACSAAPTATPLPNPVADGTSVVRKTYSPCAAGAEVVLVEIQGGGHTWPGQQPTVPFLGKSTKNVSANDLIWEFFLKHPMR